MQSGIAEVYLGEGRLRLTAHACTLGGVRLFFGCYSFATSISSLKKTLGTATPTRTTCCRHLQVRTRQQVRIMQPHAKSMSTHGFTQAWTHIHFPSLNPFSFGVVPNNLASHARTLYCLAKLYCYNSDKHN